MEARGIAWVAFLAAGAIWHGSICRAELLVDPRAGGVVLMNGANGDDEVVPLIRTFGGRFYGESVGLGTSRPLFVSENGNLNFSNNGTFSLEPLNVFGSLSFASISPLWDDYLLHPLLDNSVIDHSVANQYLGITWQNVRLFNETMEDGFFSPTTRSFQVLWFEGETTIKGVTFQPDEIVFSYVAHVAGSSDFGGIAAAVGITDGTQRFTPLPGDDDGFIVVAQSSLLAWEPGTFLRFSPQVDSGQVNYSASRGTVSAVPEPASAGVVCFAALGLAWRWKRRR